MAAEVDLSALELLKVDEVATLLRVSHATIWRLIRGKELESVKVGGARRIPPEAVIAYKNRLRGINPDHDAA